MGFPKTEVYNLNVYVSIYIMNANAIHIDEWYWILAVGRHLKKEAVRAPRQCNDDDVSMFQTSMIV